MDRPKKYLFLAWNLRTCTPATISLQELEGKSVFERVSVNIKVTRKMESEFVATGKMKQDVIVFVTAVAHSLGSHLGTHKICLRCNARVELSTSTLGRCTKSECAMLQRYDICADQLSVKMFFMAGSKIYSLNAYGKVVKNLVMTQQLPKI